MLFEPMALTKSTVLSSGALLSALREVPGDELLDIEARDIPCDIPSGSDNLRLTVAPCLDFSFDSSCNIVIITINNLILVYC